MVNALSQTIATLSGRLASDLSELLSQSSVVRRADSGVPLLTARPFRSWCDPRRADDRILASAIEISSDYALSPVGVLTRDVSLQNRCDLARMTLLPEPKLT
jgi:hypothetical protein